MSSPLSVYSQTARLSRSTISICENIDECFNELLHEDKIAVAVSRKHATNSYVVPKDQIYCFDRRDNINTNSIVLLMRRRFEYMDDVNRMLFAFIEFGLLNKWQRDSQLHAKRFASNFDYSKMTIKHFVGAIVVLGICLAFTLIAFSLELFVHFLLRRFESHRRCRHICVVIGRLIDGKRYCLIESASLEAIKRRHKMQLQLRQQQQHVQRLRRRQRQLRIAQ